VSADTRSLSGRVALITGGTRGIGRAIAETYAAAGAAVCVVARKQPELDSTVASLEGLGASATAWRGSAGDPEVVEGAVAHCIGTLGGLDVLVNNAATNPYLGPTVDLPGSALEKVLAVNVAGPVRWIQAAWHAWMADHGGVVINVASIGGLRTSPGIGIYNVSKAALIHLTRQFAGELAPTVRVNAIAPGLVRTDMARALWEPNEEAANRMQPLGRIGEPDDIAQAALYLASDASSWMTGETIVLDGGTLIR
jgi:NAD(P)-dependent dehydrogenase (short-subunit alcohol dehydrogenase family)